MHSVLITGAAGFTARHLIHALRDHGVHRITGVDLSRSVPPEYGLDEYKTLDLTDRDQVRSCVRTANADVTFHLAGIASGDDVRMYAVNCLGAVHLFDAIREIVPDCAVLTIGSAAEYGPIEARDLPVTEDHPCKPRGAYGVSKHAMVLAAMDYRNRLGLRIVVARPFNLIGPGVPSSLLVGALLQRMRQALNEGRDAIGVGNLETERDFLDVRDAVRAYISLVEVEVWGEIVNVCSGRGVPVQNVAEALLSLAPRRLRLQVDPQLVRSGDARAVVGSCAKAARLAGFEPRIDLEQSLRAAWTETMQQS